MTDTLERLIVTIETQLASIEETYGDFNWRDHEKWRAKQAAYRAVIDGLVTSDCAKYRQGVADAYVLTLAGIRTSCTGGDHGLLTNWVRRARQEIEKARREAA